MAGLGVMGGTCQHSRGVVFCVCISEPTPGGAGWRGCILGKGGSQDAPPHFYVASLESLFLNVALDLGPGKHSVASGSSGNAPKLYKKCFCGKLGEECFSQDSSRGSRNPFPLTAKGSSTIKSEDILPWQEHCWDGINGSFPAVGKAAWEPEPDPSRGQAMGGGPEHRLTDLDFCSQRQESLSNL